MASFDEIKDTIGKAAQGAQEAYEQAKPAVEGAVAAGKEKAAEFAEKADEWARQPHPEADKALEAVGTTAQGAIDAAAKGAEVAYEAIKNTIEEASGKDLDGDGQVGNTGAAPDEVKAGVKTAAEAVAGAAGKAANAGKNALENILKKDLDGDGTIGE